MDVNSDKIGGNLLLDPSLKVSNTNKKFVRTRDSVRTVVDFDALHFSVLDCISQLRIDLLNCLQHVIHC